MQNIQYGFVHFFFSCVGIWITGCAIIMLLFNGMWFLGDVFGFFFTTREQDIAASIFFSAMGACLGTIFYKLITQNKKIDQLVVLTISTLVFTSLNVVILLVMTLDTEVHYGQTGADQVPDQLINTYYAISSYIISSALTSFLLTKNFFAKR